MLNFPLTHLRHGYYLKRRHFVCSGTMKAAKEKEWCKMDIKIKEAFHPAWEDRYNRPTTARAEQPASHRPTTGRYSVSKRCKAGTAPVLPISARRPEQPPQLPVQPLAPSTPTSRSQRPTPSGSTAFHDRNYRPSGALSGTTGPHDRYYRPACAQCTYPFVT